MNHTINTHIVLNENEARISHLHDIGVHHVECDNLGSNRGSRGGATNTRVNNIYQNVKPNELIGTSSKVFIFPNFVMPK